MKLSIVIPCYNGEPYIFELLDCLAPQITNDVEVLLVDDGSDIPVKTSYKWVKVIRQENQGLSHSRNVGIESTKGEYISFIDADDLVSPTYVKDILDRIPFDILEMSWKSIGGTQCGCKLENENTFLNNVSACTRVFSRAFIGDNRFNEKKDSTEDEDFSRKLGYMRLNKNRKIIAPYTYFYRTSVVDSMSKRYLRGLTNTKRIVYYYNHVTSDMTFLLDTVKQEDEFHEVFIMTNKCDIPELSRYAQIIPPQHFRGHIIKGEKTTLLSYLPSPVKTQVCIWTNRTFNIGGIETFIYNFCMSMKEYYDITVLYNEMDIRQIERLTPFVSVVKNNVDREVVCDTLIVNRIIDKVPTNIKAKKIIQMCHTCKQNETLHIPQDKDGIICVSEAAKESFKEEAESSIVIHNLMAKRDVKRCLILMSATRLDTNDKGQKRMLKLANKLSEMQIPYIWFYFSNVELDRAPKNMVCLQPTLDILEYIQRADFLVQLSSSESFCYSIVESLSVGTPIICTDLPVLPELGIIDGVNAHVLPMDLDAEYDVQKIYNTPLKGFKYKYDNDSLIKKWREVLGDTKPLHNYVPVIVPKKKVKVLIKYNDIVLGCTLYPNQELTMPEDRALYLQNVKKFVEIID